MNKKNSPFYWKRCIIPIVLLALLIVCISTDAFFAFDMYCRDVLFQRQSVPMRDIHIVAIDEKTIAAYGDMATWNREIYANLIEKLDENPKKAPAVIGIDVMFIKEREEASDEALAGAAEKYGNVVTAANLIYKDEIVKTEDGFAVSTDKVVGTELPYEALRSGSAYGYANAVQDRDGIIRHAKIKEVFEGQDLNSFSWQIANLYGEKKGIAPALPARSNAYHGFVYSGKSGSYETISLCDVLEGRVDTAAFAGGIVLVGAYAPGLMDAYNVAVQRGEQMYGVEIHANLIEAYLENHLFEDVSKPLYIGIAAALFVLFFLLCGYISLLWEILEVVFFLIAQMGCSLVLFQKGFSVPVIYLPLFEILVTVYLIVDRYLEERVRRKKTMDAMGKYLAPQVITELTKSGEFDIQLGVSRREIAVLFVDIRGFTTLSEKMEPETVAEMLNRYLGLTTDCIFRHGGTLDKFVGDCTMGVFGAPLELEDPIYKAVCAAMDMVREGNRLGKELEKKYGTTVSFGVGVNYGPAVVGNIGCDFRMDYTAIGDTVNTAARLEANAKAGQVLISNTVQEALQGRIQAEPVGEIPLKGKAKGVFVYDLKEVL